MRTRRLTKCVLDLAVVLAEGYRVYATLGGVIMAHRGAGPHLKLQETRPSRSTTGDALLAREGIEVRSCLRPGARKTIWLAQKSDGDRLIKCDGGSRLEAGLRCYVLAYFGETFSIPKDVRPAMRQFRAFERAMLESVDALGNPTYTLKSGFEVVTSSKGLTYRRTTDAKPITAQGAVLMPRVIQPPRPAPRRRRRARMVRDNDPRSQWVVNRADGSQLVVRSITKRRKVKTPTLHA